MSGLARRVARHSMDRQAVRKLHKKNRLMQQRKWLRAEAVARAAAVAAIARPEPAPRRDIHRGDR